MSLDLSSREFVLAVNQDPPYFEFEDRNNKLVLKSGLEVEILKAISVEYNFTYRLIDCNGSWGSLQPDNSWSGIIGQLDRKLADIGLGEVSITGERAQYVHFSYPHTISTITFITSPPKSYSKISSMLDFFDPYIWISIIITLLIIILFLMLLARLYKIIFVDLIWIMFEQLLRQPTKSINTFSTFSFTLLFMFWLIFCTIFSTIYSNCIYSSIIFPLDLKSINTIEELSMEKMMGKIKVSILEDTSKLSLLKQSDLEMYRKLSENVDFYKNDAQGIEAVIKSNSPKAHILAREYLSYVFIKYSPGSYYIPPYSDETTFFLDLLAIAYRKNFEYKEQFDHCILAMKESGLFDYWMLAMRARPDNNDDNDEHFEFGLHHYDIYFYLLIFGNAISSIIFMFECVNCFSTNFSSRLKKY